MFKSVLIALVFLPVLLLGTGCPCFPPPDMGDNCDGDPPDCYCPPPPEDPDPCQEPDPPCDEPDPPCDEPDPPCDNQDPADPVDSNDPPDPDDPAEIICSNQGLVLEALSNGDIRVTYPGGFGGGNAYVRVTAGNTQLVEIMNGDPAQSEVVFTPGAEGGSVTVVAEETIHCGYGWE